MGVPRSWLAVLACFSAVVATTGGAGVASEDETPAPDDPLIEFQSAILPEAWEITREAPDIVVAVIDSGVERDHPDLAGNLWINSGEIPGNGYDDDANGYVDDWSGYDFVEDDADPDDPLGHGTLISGIIGAVGNNGIGIAGAAWRVQLMPLKVLGGDGTARLIHVIEAIDYAIRQGADILSAAWTFDPTDRDPELGLLQEALERAEEAGLLVVAAAGNEGTNLDDGPVFPASYDLPNLISVAAYSENDGGLIAHSNWGSPVHLAAPGEQILGTLGEEGYGSLTGTSAASALVTGAAALLWTAESALSPSDLREVLVAGTDRIGSLEGMVSSSGTLNIHQSLLLAQSGVPAGEETGTTPAGTSAAGLSAGCSLHR